MIQTLTAVVTGAARGIGLATTRRLVSQGYRVAMVDIDSAELDLSSKPFGDRVVTIPADVSAEREVELMAELVELEFGTLNVLVNNAAVAEFCPVEEATYEHWRRIMANNLDSVFLVSQAMMPLLKHAAKTTNSAIVNVASISGLRASTLRVAYGTSKAGVIQLSLQQAAEFAEYGIRVNCVAPGPVNTRLAMNVHTPEIRASYHDAIPLNRYGNEMEIANAICFLCSRDASYITGQILAADGGFEATGVGLPALRQST